MTTCSDVRDGWLDLRSISRRIAGAWLGDTRVYAGLREAAERARIADSQKATIGEVVRYSPSAQRTLLEHVGKALGLGRDWPRLAMEAIERAEVRQ